MKELMAIRRLFVHNDHSGVLDPLVFEVCCLNGALSGPPYKFVCWHSRACVIIANVSVRYHSVAGAVQIKRSTEQVLKQ